MTMQLPHTLEDWNSAEFVNAWLERSVRTLDVRKQRYLLMGALLGFAPDAAFRFVDVGGGGGWLIATLLDAYPNSTAVWLDMSAPMEAAARQTLAGHGDRVTYVRADLSVPGWSAALRAERLQAAVSTIAIHNLFDPAAIRGVYRDLAAVLDPGAVFVDNDYTAGHPSLLPQYRSAAAHRRGDRAGTGVGGGGHFAGTLADHLQWLHDAGFSAVDCAWRELNLSILLAKK